MPGDETALLADQIRLLMGVERHVDVEEREHEDEDEVRPDIEEAGRRQAPPHETLEPIHLDHVGQQDRDVEHRRGEDDRDDAGLVHLQRDVGAAPPVHSATDDPAGEGDRNASLALVEEDDGHQQDEGDGDDDPELELAALGQNRPEPVRDGRHHVGEDQDRHALPDAALGDELGEPHDERRPGGQDQDHERGQGEAELRNEVDRGAEQCGVVPVEGVDQAGRLHERQRRP